jgi:CubicO group peptidase (beta-lactamase class C family)
LIAASRAGAAGETTPQRVQAAVDKLDALASDAMRRTGIPGMAVAVVYEDRAIHLKGYGVREAGKPEPIDADTVFQVASLSKPITSTVLAALVGEKKIDWGDRASDLYPSFRLQELWPSREATIRDFLCHRSGLPAFAGDLLEDMGYDRNQVLHRLRFLKPASSFRTEFAYTNFGFTAGAEAAAQKLGVAWEDLIAEKLFRPLEMHSTSSRYADYLKRPNRALIHSKVGEQWLPKNIRDPDAQSPAGGVSSSIRDLTAWMRLQLADGKFNGKQVVAAEALAETHRPQIVVNYNAQTRRAGCYGLGWNVSDDDQGRVYWRHSGAFFLGARTEVSLLPAEGLGIVVLCNSGPHGIPEAVTMSFFDDVLLGKPSRDWIAFANRMFDLEKNEIDGALTDFSHPPASPSPAGPLASYVGVYDNEYYGPVETVEKGDSLAILLGPEKKSFPLRHWNRDLYLYMPPGESAAGLSGVTFLMGADGRAQQVVVENLNAQGQGAFLRRKP